MYGEMDKSTCKEYNDWICCTRAKLPAHFNCCCTPVSRYCTSVERSSEKTYLGHAILMSANWTVCYPCVLTTIGYYMQCTSYYIGYLHLKLVVGMKDQRVFMLPTEGLLLRSCTQPATPPDGCQQIFADQLHKLTDRPHKVAKWQIYDL